MLDQRLGSLQRTLRIAKGPQPQLDVGDADLGGELLGRRACRAQPLALQVEGNPKIAEILFRRCLILDEAGERGMVGAAAGGHGLARVGQRLLAAAERRGGLTALEQEFGEPLVVQHTLRRCVGLLAHRLQLRRIRLVAVENGRDIGDTARRCRVAMTNPGHRQCDGNHSAKKAATETSLCPHAEPRHLVAKC